MNINNEQFITTIGLLITVIALVLSIIQSLKARIQTNKLSVVANAMSTKYIDTFPDYIPQIAELISKAKTDIKILSPLPQHGVFSTTSGYLQIKHNIEKKKVQCPKVKINCIFSNEENQRKLLYNQFSKYKDNWEEWCSDSKQKEKIRVFRQLIENIDCNKVVKFEEFIDLFIKAGQADINSTFLNENCIYIDHRPPLNLWIIDEREAIFAISQTTGEYFVEAFWTTDNRLVSGLVKMFNEYYTQDEIKKSTKMNDSDN